MGGSLPSGMQDLNWKIARDSINGIYQAAIVMNPLDPNYFQSAQPDCKWISFSPSGEHSGSGYFFYKIEFDLACFDSCGRSFNDDGTFCLNLDLYADNSIFEIFVNGVAQSSRLGNIPLPNPFNPVGHTPHDKTQVQLCSNWKTGSNVLIIQVASSATVAGMLAEGSVTAPPPPDTDTIPASICEGEVYRFGNINLTQTGYYFKSFHLPTGCDSNVMLHLNVTARAKDTIRHSICEGENYLGYSTSGTYTDAFAGSNGCDSLRVLILTVQEKPRPNLKPTAVLCNDSLILSPGQFNSYLWQDGSTLDHFVVRSTGTYSVSVTNTCGSTEATVIVSNGVCGVYFPNAFTPNGDGKNEIFKVVTDNRLQEYHLLIFNRWGQKIFESNDPAKGWDGTVGGKRMVTGTYIWRCWYKKSNETTSMSGSVILIR